MPLALLQLHELPPELLSKVHHRFRLEAETDRTTRCNPGRVGLPGLGWKGLFATPQADEWRGMLHSAKMASLGGI